MKLVIAHLYYDLMNLYGESGNVLAIKKSLEQLGIDVSVLFLTIDDTLDFSKYDVIYIGAGTEDNQLIALKHLIHYKSDVEEAIRNHKFFMITGNALELFGKYIIEMNRKKHKALHCFPYITQREVFHMADEALFKCDFLKSPILGFQNQNSVIRNLKNPMFEIIRGIGSYPKSTGEGIHMNNFYGTYLIGPVLIRNPHFLQYYIKELVTSIDPDFKMEPLKLDLERDAYDAFMNHYYKHYNAI